MPLPKDIAVENDTLNLAKTFTRKIELLLQTITVLDRQRRQLLRENAELREAARR